MPYLERDASGSVIRLHAEATEQNFEFVPAAHPDVKQFLEQAPADAAADHARRQMAELDSSMIRVLEDLLDVLLQKHIIMLTDLPPEAQKKLLSRKAARQTLLSDAGGLNNGADDIF